MADRMAWRSTGTATTKFLKKIEKNWQLLVILFLPLCYYIIFHYAPMYGVLIAFKKFSARKGILASDWIGLKYFKKFLTDPYFYKLVRNTLMLNLLTLIFGFPAPILFALLLNEIKSNAFKRFVQTASYLPHFISTVVLCGMVVKFCEVKGLINDIFELLGGKRIGFLQDPKYFRTIFVLQHIWKSLGWNAIIYIAALTGIAPELYESAEIEGANRFQKIYYITLPGISPTIIMMLILRIGNLMNLGHEVVMLLYNSMLYETADIISTYVYRRGLVSGEYSYATAVGLVNSIVSLILVTAANAVSRRFSETSLW
ncbi:MAG: sugar ABC transporter permease [Clostridia bacterium]|nr:sugar ABC transporter permease [Clostridia bacterium]